MTQHRMTDWEELDYADQLVVVYQHVPDMGTAPEFDHWVELVIDDVDWTASWIDRQVGESTYKPNEDGPAYVLRRQKTEVSWGADAAHIEIGVWVANHLFDFALGVGIPALAKKINERLKGRYPAEVITREIAIGRATQRVALRADVDFDALRLTDVIERDDAFQVILRAPDGAVYSVEIGALGPNVQRFEVRRSYPSVD